ncbi:MAG: TraR/DksA C4-type zinc finger protein [bacterium]
MKESELRHFKKLLLERRKELLNEMSAIKNEESESTLKEEDGDSSAYGFHLADQGTDSITQEQNFLYAQRDSRLLYHIDMALERIEEDIYGLCENCGLPISKDRLEALPHARLCISCKAQEEGLDLNVDQTGERSINIYDEELEEFY